MTRAALDVLAERQRQLTVKGWTLSHDDDFTAGELEKAAACYAIQASGWLQVGSVDAATYSQAEPLNGLWPWDLRWWKPEDPREDLLKAGALTLAAIERRDRAEGRPANAAALQRQAMALVMAAQTAGLVLTIEQRPLPPLAMGNYETVVSVRQAIAKGGKP